PVLVVCCEQFIFFFFSSRRRHTRFSRDWSSDVCSSDLEGEDMIVEVLSGAIRAGTSVLYASAGELISQRAGVINLGTEGSMLAGDRESGAEGKGGGPGGRATSK